MTSSLPPDITEAIPFPLTAGGAQAQSAFPADGRFDVSIGSLGFLLRPTAQDPYLRASEQASKQRVDTAPEAGEQSLSSWWLRSQTSWHRGAGIDWYEPGSDEGTAYRFHNSHNVDVWTPGEIKLLPKLVNSLATGVAAYGSTVRMGGFNMATIGYGDNLLIPPSTVETLTSGLATKPAVNGDSIYVGHEDAVSRASVTSGTVTKIRDTTGVARCWWVKSRLFVAVGPTIYWVDTTTSTGTLGTAGTDESLWTHPDPDWVWTDITPTGDAILLGGHSASQGFIYSMTVAEEAGVVEFTTPAETAALPPGELLTCMGSYLNLHLVLGTTRGVRVAVVGDGGRIQYGQVTVETDEPVRDVAFTDRFAYLPVTRALADGTSGLVRIDLSEPIPDSTLYAWAWDMSSGTAAEATGVVLYGEGFSPALITDLNLQVPGAYAEEGWIEMGRVRYGTTEPKNFRLFRANGELNGGTVRVAALVNGNESNLITYAPASGIGGETAINLPQQKPYGDMAFRLYLTPQTSPDDDTPLVEDFAVKALPAVRKARLYQFPLSCFSTETDRYGNEVGYDGAAYDRLIELEALEATAQPVLVKDHRTDEAFVGVIESMEFSGQAAPERDRDNFGGTLTVTMRRM